MQKRKAELAGCRASAGAAGFLHEDCLCFYAFIGNIQIIYRKEDLQ